MASDAAVQDATNKAQSSVKWMFNQFHPFGAEGKLGRTLMITSSLAVAGFAAAATGTPVPVDVGPSFLPDPTADGTGEVTFWSAMGSAGSSYVAHAWNGAAYFAGGVQNLATNADWPTAIDALTAESG